MQLAQIYAAEVQSSMRRLMAVLEPALIVGLALLVCAFMLSLIIPILSIN
jgi:general secretion pathway protein F